MSQGAWSEPGVDAIVRLVHARTGLVFPPNRQPSAEAGIRRAMARVGVSNPERYVPILREGGAALDDLVAELTIGESYFFREPGQLDFVRRQVIPEIMHRRGPSHPIRVWSAGCAAGEEAYSLAIILGEGGLLDQSRVLGTDISRPRLAAARRGQYTQWALRGVPDDVVGRYFERRDKQFRLDPAIRNAVEYRYLNLAEDSYPGSSTGVWGMDLIVCRNVLIYFDADTVRLVASQLMESLSEDGWLVIGASDPMLSEVVPCDVVTTGAGLAYRRMARARLRQPSPPGPPVAWSRDTAGVAPPRLEGLEPPQAPADVTAPAPPSPNGRVPAAEVDHDFRARVEQSYAARDFDEVVELARRYLDRDPDDAAVWALAVRALANSGRLVEAGVMCAAALDMHGTSAELLYLHSLLLGEAGRLAEAAAAARRALYLDRELIVAHLALGTTLSRLGDVAGAARAFGNAEDLLAKLPASSVAPASDGETALRLGEIVRAQRGLLGGAVA